MQVEPSRADIRRLERTLDRGKESFYVKRVAYGGHKVAGTFG
jgi:hypothetical protein